MIRHAIHCDTCGQTQPVTASERPWQTRNRLRIIGWRQADARGRRDPDGKRDLCPACVAARLEVQP